MSYIQNKNVNLINIHTGLHRFSTTAIFIFGVLYLLEQGLSLNIVLLIWASNFLLRLILRPISLKLSQKIGLKRAVILGIFFYSGIFPILSQITGMNIWVFVFMLYFSIADILYWLPYHAYYAALGESENRGKHIGAREMLAMILTSIAPLMSGFLIDTYGFWTLYLMSMTVMLIGSIPVFFVPSVSPGQQMNYKTALKEIDKKGFWLLLSDSIAYYSHIFLWPIVLFFMVKNFTVFGGLISLEIFLNAIMFLLIGHLIDKGKGKKITLIAFILMSGVILGRVFVVYDMTTILIFEALFAFSVCFYSSSLNSGFYNLAKKSNNVLWFHFFGEIGWDIGAIITLPLASLWVFFGFELRFYMIFGLIGLFTVKTVLDKYYKIEKCNNDK